MNDPAPNWSRVTRSAEETVRAGRELAAQLTPPVVLLLAGELGAGKTTLCKGVISGLGAAREEEVTSPTFTLVHEFRAARPDPLGGGPDRRAGGVGGKVYHVDLYRVSNVHDLETLGLEDILAEPAVILVEWPERLTLRTDWPLIHVRLEILEDDRRRISVFDPRGALDAGLPAAPRAKQHEHRR